MSHLENIVFNTITKPKLYARYVDDILILCPDTSYLETLQEQLQVNSVLRFTTEVSNFNKQLPYLDLLVTQTADGFRSTVYTKPTSGGGDCLSGESYCPERYKSSVIAGYLNRAYNYSHTWADFDTEIKRIKALLINNQHYG